MHFYNSQFARGAQSFRKLKTRIRIFISPRRRERQVQTRFFAQKLCVLAPLREIFRDLVAALPRCGLLRYRMFAKPVDEEIPQGADFLRRWFPRREDQGQRVNGDRKMSQDLAQSAAFEILFDTVER